MCFSAATEDRENGKEIQMEKITKGLKSISTFIGILALYQVYNLITAYQLASSLEQEIVGAMSAAVLPAAKIVSVLPMAVSALVHLFLCFRGHREANDPSPAKFHIVLAVIWMLGSVLSVISGVATQLDGVTVNGILNVLISASTGVLLFFYSKYAKAIRTAE